MSGFEPDVPEARKLILLCLMKLQRSAILVSFLAATTLLLCAPSSPATDTGSASASMKNLSVTVEGGTLAKTNHTSVISKSANHSDEPPFMNGEPEHISLSFDNDSVKDFDPESHRQLLVYPLPSYAVLFKGKEKAQFDKQLVQSKKILSNKSIDGVKEIPILPAVEAFQVFHNHVKYLPFKQGSGVAFLTSYAQDEAPIENGNIFYTYQGISADGKYYLSLVYPVKANKLPTKASVKVGIAALAKLSDDQFTPSLVEIDKLIQSISIK
jgi:hypothetical protein